MGGPRIQNSKMFVRYDVLKCSRFFWYMYIMYRYIFKVLRSLEVNEGQSFDLRLAWTDFLCNTSVLSCHLICNMPILLATIILTNLEFLRPIKIIRDQIRVMRCHLIQKSKTFIIWYTKFSAFYIYIINMFQICSKSFEVIRGQWSSAWG